MEIQFVNHASFTVTTPHLKMLSDPWLEGHAFNEGWGLLADTDYDSIGFDELTHLWFSHEHPDHFHPPSLRKLSAEVKSKLTVLFQKTIDRKVTDYTSDAGFGSVRELEPGGWERIAEDVEVLCCPWDGFEDSWICIRTPETTVLNVNDCAVNTREEAQSIKDRVGHIDALFTQFGISAWDGNEEELERRLAGSRGMIDRMVTQVRVFQPEYVVPFASFVWFCHEENHFMNSGLSSIREVVDAIESRTDATPVILYPGDRWVPGEERSSADSIERYTKDKDALAVRETKKAKHFDENELIEAGREYCKKLTEGSGPGRVRLALIKQNAFRIKNSSAGGLSKLVSLLSTWLFWRPAQARIFVSDLNQAYTFDLGKGLRRADLEEKDCQVAMGSDSLMYAFKFLWGGHTLLFNGRFREIRHDSRAEIFDYFNHAGSINAGKQVTWRGLLGGALRRCTGSSSASDPAGVANSDEPGGANGTVVAPRPECVVKD